MARCVAPLAMSRPAIGASSRIQRPLKASGVLILGVWVACLFNAAPAWLVAPAWGPRRDLRQERRIFKGQPHFRPAYGFEPPPAMGPKAAEGEAVPGLKIWLKHMGLQFHLDKTNAWCKEMGAAVLNEVVESVEDLAEALPLLPEEEERLLSRARIALSTLEQKGELVPMQDIKPAENLETLQKFATSN
mmetsp:Transcript_29721/g.64749  ORF Transcript_29721/g.64749 Transcript_29721/m.64749 type:complete len:189 (+) Transcript_29721:41-607(+)|eukprot:CAMPEP_0170614832 /NCGR_PEP_ID=MMETSP0224-20130122/25014_1 /TAXON_ID=285029 /ORGANISM="Togula jolla, Strain CCCM 725" /LENGTH=188 /DNA_ID=CAMNT_0010940523 /DNA_START=41 /DNA_END=607 /DNA_ORIENTATION=-